MDTTAFKNEIRMLWETSEIAYVASVNENGFPQMKAMLVFERDSMATQYFSTNTSSRRVKQFRDNPKASVYYCDAANFKGALFTGTIEVCTDTETKKFLWREGFEMYYPEGVTDEDYCVFKFTAATVNYYHGEDNISFEIDELKQEESACQKS